MCRSFPKFVLRWPTGIIICAIRTLCDDCASLLSEVKRHCGDQVPESPAGTPGFSSWLCHLLVVKSVFLIVPVSPSVKWANNSYT